MLVRRALLALSLLALLPSLSAQIVLSHFDLTEEGQPDSTSVAVEIPSMVQRDLLHQGGDTAPLRRYERGQCPVGER